MAQCLANVLEDKTNYYNNTETQMQNILPEDQGLHPLPLSQDFQVFPI